MPSGKSLWHAAHRRRQGVGKKVLVGGSGQTAHSFSIGGSGICCFPPNKKVDRGPAPPMLRRDWWQPSPPLAKAYSYRTPPSRGGLGTPPTWPLHTVVYHICSTW